MRDGSPNSIDGRVQWLCREEGPGARISPWLRDCASRGARHTANDGGWYVSRTTTSSPHVDEGRSRLSVATRMDASVRRGRGSLIRAE
ncbi:MAG: hypothetical protein HYY93_07855 [Planctomycetes bacterium]|nr:hypothetical protein [Planctomycetota bacterium]